MSDYYRVKKFSQLTSTTVKTLRHYNEIGLLKPTQKTVNGYKLYSDHDALRLQQIMTFKFLSYPLNEIKIILSDKSDNMIHFLETQSHVLKKEAISAQDKAWLMDQIIIHKKQSPTLNWGMIDRLMEVLQLDKNDNLLWQTRYYTESEYSALTQISLKYSADYWDNFFSVWTLLHQEIQSQLHTHPEGEIGLMLGKKWLDLKDTIQADPALQKKGWEAFQKGIVPQEAVVYDSRVIEYITKATKKYKEL